MIEVQGKNIEGIENCGINGKTGLNIIAEYVKFSLDDYQQGFHGIWYFDEIWKTGLYGTIILYIHQNTFKYFASRLRRACAARFNS